MSKITLRQNEYPDRVARARVLMAEHGLDALLIFTGPNMAYLNGATQADTRSGSRPYIYLLPRYGDPVLIVHSGRQFEARSLTDVQDVRTYDGLSRLPLEEVVAAIDEKKLGSKCLGLEMGGEMVLDLPLAEILRLQEALPNVEWRDASPLLWQMRMLKSEAEIACVAKACAITSQAYAQTFSSLREGMTEIEIERMMWSSMLTLGGSSPWVLVTSGQGNYDLVSKGGTSRQVESADMVWMDSGCMVEGYWSDFSRGGVIGGPTPEQAATQQEIHQITRMGVDMVQPGVPVAEIAVRCNEAIDALGWSITSNISGLASRVGHGLGLRVTELPSLSEDDPTVLVPGMIVTIEPGVATSYGTFHIEENVLVTEVGPQILSSPHWQLWSI